jgi:hypothetical protein
VAQVHFVDTSILLELLAVPGKSQQPGPVKQRLDELLSLGTQLVLPIAAVIETGNHIVQLPDGTSRRSCAERFVALLRMTAAERLPWVLHTVAWDERMLTKLCDGTAMTGPFVDLAGAGVIGTGDLAILAECESYAERTAHVEVKVWTLDERLAAYGG